MNSSGTHFLRTIEYGTTTIAKGQNSVNVTFLGGHNYQPIIVANANKALNVYITNLTNTSATINVSGEMNSSVTVYYQVISQP